VAKYVRIWKEAVVTC